MVVSLDKDLAYILRLRDCFEGGYTFPQFCIENGIKKPLFVTEKKFLTFMWEIYVQFRYDKRMLADFSVLDLPTDEVKFSIHNTLSAVRFKNFSEINPDDFDAIILLTLKDIDVKKNVISFFNITRHFLIRTYAEIPAMNFLQRHPGVKLFYTILPVKLDRYEGGKEFSQTHVGFDELVAKIKANKGKAVPTPIDKFGYTNKEFISLVHFGNTVTNLDGTTVMNDSNNPLIRIENGKRMTAYQPEQFKNRIFFVGPCHYLGLFAPYDKTIESYLQKMLNENNLPYRVENESQRFVGRYQDIFYNLNKINPVSGDIVFIWITNNLHSRNLPFIDLSDAFDPPHDYREIFCHEGHFHELGYKILAEKFFNVLTKNNFFRDLEYNFSLPPLYYHRYGIPAQFETGGSKSFVNEDLEAYKKTLQEKKIPIGALVMNCNPFTLGHQYLVEYAAARVTKLYLFVVEEDKSEFPFADRIELVRQGVKHIPNVEVLPSGKFIISQQTFSGYFNKASLQDVAVDSSEDVEIFGKEIAPTLGITIRFAGEEPTDNVTRQYNETMKKILPHYGVEFCEIPRKEFGYKPISASIVREALKRGDFDKIKNLVPDTTLIYLRGRYSMSK